MEQQKVERKKLVRCHFKLGGCPYEMHQRVCLVNRSFHDASEPLNEVDTLFGMPMFHSTLIRSSADMAYIVYCPIKLPVSAAQRTWVLEVGNNIYSELVKVDGAPVQRRLRRMMDGHSTDPGYGEWSYDMNTDTIREVRR